ncbi:MAG: FAD-dependent monooxygenase [Gammaproteobacteria bacterium]
MQSHLDHDIVIVGAGHVGASLALALRDVGFNIALVDKHPQTSKTDHRVFALSNVSQRFLASIGIWQYVDKVATRIDHIHTSSRGSFGVTRFDAEKMGLAALGYMLSAEKLNDALQARLNDAGITQYRPMVLNKFEQCDEGLNLYLKQPSSLQEGGNPSAPLHNKMLKTSLLIGADGVNSTVRELADIPVEKKDYHQQAVVALVNLSRDHQHVAYERFLKNGAIALLPYGEKQSVLIWSADHDDANTLMALSDNDFLRELQDAFGYRLGPLKDIRSRFSYPLTQTQALMRVKSRVILMGNAALSLHPIAAQGFNLAIKHTIMLAETFRQAREQNKPFYSTPLLRDLAHRQEKTSRRTRHFTESILAFSSDRGLLRSRISRSSVLLAAEIFKKPLAKTGFFR